MKNIFLLLFVIMIACNRVDPYVAAKLINQNVEQKLDSLYKKCQESVLLFNGLHEVIAYRDSSIHNTEQMLKDEKLQTFDSEIKDIDKFEKFEKIISKIQRDQRNKYERLCDGNYRKADQDMYSIFSLNKDQEIFDFYNREGFLQYEVADDLILFEGIDDPVFIKNVSPDSFSLITKDLKEIVFNRINDVVVPGEFEPYKHVDNKFNFTITIKGSNKVVVYNSEYTLGGGQRISYNNQVEYWANINGITNNEDSLAQIELRQLSIKNGSNDKSRIDAISHCGLSRNDIWARKIKETLSASEFLN